MIPGDLTFLMVDEVIEAVEYSYAHISTERWHIITAELMRLAPDAYRRHGVRLARIWNALDPEMQKDIHRAYRADYLGERPAATDPRD